MLVEEGSRDRMVRCTVREAGGAVALRGEDSSFLYFCLFRWE